MRVACVQKGRPLEGQGSYGQGGAVDAGALIAHDRERAARIRRWTHCVFPLMSTHHVGAMALTTSRVAAPWRYRR